MCVVASYVLGVLVLLFSTDSIAPIPIVDLQNKCIKLNSDDPIENHYRFIRPLGRESFGAVQLAQVVTNPFQSVWQAVKIVPLQLLRKPVDLVLLNEIEHLKGNAEAFGMLDSNRCPFTLNLRCYYDSANFYVPMQYYPGGSVQELIYSIYMQSGAAHGLSERATRRFFIPLVRHVKLLHDSRRIHRDLKWTNVLLDRDGSPKVRAVVDFGLSATLSGGSFDFDNWLHGTLGYIPKDHYVKHRAEEDYKPSSVVDIHALGVMLMEMRLGYNYLSASTVEEAERKFDGLHAFIEGNPLLSDPLKKLLNVLLFPPASDTARDERERYFDEELEERDAWYKGGITEKLLDENEWLWDSDNRTQALSPYYPVWEHNGCTCMLDIVDANADANGAFFCFSSDLCPGGNGPGGSAPASTTPPGSLSYSGVAEGKPVKYLDVEKTFWAEFSASRASLTYEGLRKGAQFIEHLDLPQPDSTESQNQATHSTSTSSSFSSSSSSFSFSYYFSVCNKQ